jgi:hypothetical protein
LNNARAAYKQAMDTLIATNEDIKTLPNVRDREARANSVLHQELMTIQSYENEATDLDSLYKVVCVKQKNLCRFNTDIKLQMRLMESQVKLGNPMMDNSAAKSLFDELSKSATGTDSFEGMETAVDETKTVDPTTALDVNGLLTLPQEDFKKSVDEYTVQQAADEAEEEEEEIAEELIDPTLAFTGPASPDDDPLSCVEQSPDKTEEIPTVDGSVIDLDKMLEPEKILKNPEPIGGTTVKIAPQDESNQKQTHAVPVEEQSNKNPDNIVVVPEPAVQPEKLPVETKSDDLSIEALLSQFK